MKADMLILSAKPNLDSQVSTVSKDNQTNTISFEKILQNATSINDVGLKQTKVNVDNELSGLETQLDQAIQFLNGALHTQTLPSDTKVTLQKLVKLLATVKNDLKDGQKEGKAAVSFNVTKLFTSLSDMKKILQDNQGNSADDQLKKLLDDFKKKNGTDLVTVIQMVVQTLTAHFALNKDESQNNKTQPVEPTNKRDAEGHAKGTPAQSSGPKITTDSKNTVSPTDIKNKTATLEQASNAKNQSVSGDGKSKMITLVSTSDGKNLSAQSEKKTPSQQTQDLKSFQWVSGGPINKIQQLILHSVQPKSATPADQILSQVREVISKGIIKPLPDGGLELTIKLYPANLGTVQVVLTETQAGLQATLMAHSQATKDLLQSQLSQLKQSFATLGINVQKLDVGQFNQPQAQQNPSQFNGQAFQQQGGNPQDGQGSSHSQQTDTDIYELEPESTFDEWLREGGLIQ